MEYHTSAKLMNHRSTHLCTETIWSKKNQGTEKFKPNENIFIKVHGGTTRRYLASGIDICGQTRKKKKKILNSLNPKCRIAVTSRRQ